MKIKPLFDRILLEPICESKEQKIGALVLPSSAQDMPLLGKVIAIGNGKMADEKEIDMQIKNGDIVLYNKYSGCEFKEKGKSYVLMRQSEVLAIVEEYDD